MTYLLLNFIDFHKLTADVTQYSKAKFCLRATIIQASEVMKKTNMRLRKSNAQRQHYANKLKAFTVNTAPQDKSECLLELQMRKNIKVTWILDLD